MRDVSYVLARANVCNARAICSCVNVRATMRMPSLERIQTYAVPASHSLCMCLRVRYAPVQMCVQLCACLRWNASKHMLCLRLIRYACATNARAMQCIVAIIPTYVKLCEVY
jgi:hypothetical protein